MPRIKILQEDLRNKIAAGEVVERPMSVVKELIENSIDEGSTSIEIDVLYGGKHLIRVSDNGAGMDKEDALLAFERHATSKLLKEDDLFNISTLGFRGEALPAIASISKIKLLTGTKSSTSGVSLVLNGGKLKEVKEAPPYSGTSIEVKDLFFNTPARKKFLKANSTELYHIFDTVTKAAIAHWDIGFRITTDHHETMNLPVASGLKERLVQIYGNEFLADFSEIKRQNEDISLHSFVSNPKSFRKTRGNQFIFINKRPVKDPTISHAIYKALEGILPQGRHPVFFLLLSVAPQRVDSNVHPAKREVRFDDKESIYKFVYSNLRDAVKSERAEYARQFAEIPEAGSSPQSPGAYTYPNPSDSVPHKSVVAENLELAYKPSLPFIYLGDTFIALSGKGGLTIIDHHAAHERILYEKLLEGMSSISRQLLFPQQIRLQAKEYSVLLQNIHIMKNFGLEIDDFGKNTVIVRSIPDELNDADIQGILSDIATGMVDGTVSHKSLKKDLAALIACHSSIRGKAVLAREEISRLIEDLEKTENPDQCPHGRPTRIFYTINDLNKMFKRK
jgi:DNA mismatch repair protein MutL